MFLTKRQNEIYQYLKEHIRDQGYAPSIAEIGEKFNLSSPATVHKHLVHLESKGLIRKYQNLSRAIEIVSEDSKGISPKANKELVPIVTDNSTKFLENKSIFPSIPGTTIGLPAMANATRIASEVDLG